MEVLRHQILVIKSGMEGHVLIINISAVWRIYLLLKIIIRYFSVQSFLEKGQYFLFKTLRHIQVTDAINKKLIFFDTFGNLKKTLYVFNHLWFVTVDGSAQYIYLFFGDVVVLPALCIPQDPIPLVPKGAQTLDWHYHGAKCKNSPICFTESPSPCLSAQLQEQARDQLSSTATTLLE